MFNQEVIKWCYIKGLAKCKVVYILLTVFLYLKNLKNPSKWSTNSQKGGSQITQFFPLCQHFHLPCLTFSVSFAVCTTSPSSRSSACSRYGFITWHSTKQYRLFYGSWWNTRSHSTTEPTSTTTEPTSTTTTSTVTTAMTITHSKLLFCIFDICHGTIFVLCWNQDFAGQFFRH